MKRSDFTRLVIVRHRVEFGEEGAVDPGGWFAIESDDGRLLVHDVAVDTVIMVIGAVDRAKLRVGAVEAEQLGGGPDAVGAGAFDFDEARDPRPGVEADFAAVKLPFLAESLLVSFASEMSTFDEGDRTVVVVGDDINFPGAEDVVVVFDVFISQDDFAALVADADELVRAGVEDDAFHLDFWLGAGSAGALEPRTEGGFVDVEELGFDFVIHTIYYSTS